MNLYDIKNIHLKLLWAKCDPVLTQHVGDLAILVTKDVKVETKHV